MSKSIPSKDDASSTAREPVQHRGPRRKSATEGPETFPNITGYVLHEEIHRGGQGTIFRATQEATGREVAIKVLLEGAFASEIARRRGRSLLVSAAFFLLLALLILLAILYTHERAARLELQRRYEERIESDSNLGIRAWDEPATSGRARPPD